MPFRKLFADIFIQRKKTCACCNAEKDIEEFVYMKTKNDHRSDVCRVCTGIFDYNVANVEQSILKLNVTH